MKTGELPKSYAPADAEAHVSARWSDAEVFHAEPGDPGDPYCIVIPPPNVTAPLHLGHGFNNSIQDVLIRFHRMRGFNTLWMPGTDHAGIATQAVVEKRLLQKGSKRTDFTREEFVARVQKWKDEYEATIISQLQAMGCSCDWQRVRFTMDDMCARAVREAFFRLFKDGLIYRGKRLVNWDPVTLTALADDEVEMKEVAGHMWYLRYPLVDANHEPVTWAELWGRGYPKSDETDVTGDAPAWITVATTRPETYLGDTAVAVNPTDRRAAALDGLMVKLPLVGRIIPIVHDDYVVLPVALGGDAGDPKAQFATGFLKVTPAHDPNDWDIGIRHDLPVINVLAPDATISDAHGWEDVGDASQFVGLMREVARSNIVDEFKARGLLEATRDYSHSVGHSYRSHVPIEPYLSDQWYVRVTDSRMRCEALRAMADEQYEGDKPTREAGARAGDGELLFFPARYAKTFQSWHENLRDWCISRQLWWGHRIPVWRRPQARDEITPDELEEFAQFTEQLLDWQRQGRIALQYRGEFAPISPFEKADVDLTAFFVCMLDSACDTEIVQALEAAGLEQDPDVLDTWFSSGLWPISTMGWPAPEDYPETEGLLETFNPSSVLVTGRDIITLWVSRMVMFNRYFRDGKLPFRHVYINPMIQDGYGQRMSKSLGNGVDPIDIVHGHGADAMRFTLVQMATATQDVRMPVNMLCPHCGHKFSPPESRSPAGYRVASPEVTCPKCGGAMISNYGFGSGEVEPTDAAPLARNTSRDFDKGRNFANKVFNATRFALGKLTSAPIADLNVDQLPLVDRWIITQLHRTLHKVEDALEGYQFNVYADALYDFIHRDFCDWYLEAIKPTVTEDPMQQQALRTVLDASLRLLHPICPFLTESLWPYVQSTGEAGIDGIVLPSCEILAKANWPDIACRVDDKDAAGRFADIQSLVRAINKIRGEHDVPPQTRIELYASAATLRLIEPAEGAVLWHAILSSIAPFDERPDDAMVITVDGRDEALGGLGGTVDAEAERQRLAERVKELERNQAALTQRLSNPGYVEKAPVHLVEETRQNLAEVEQELEAVRQALKS